MDYKKSAVGYKAEGHTFKELKSSFKIPPKTYYEWKEKQENGYCESKEKKTHSRKIDREKLRRAIEEKPDAYLYERGEVFGCTAQAIFYALKEMKITYKKTFTYSEKSEAERAEYVEKLSKMPMETVVYVDDYVAMIGQRGSLELDICGAKTGQKRRSTCTLTNRK